MTCAKSDALDSSSMGEVQAVAGPTQLSAHPSPEARKLEPEEKAKRTKHTRVQKREKELYGLVTPVFLPLLDARDVSPKENVQTLDAATAPVAAPAECIAPTGDAEKSRDGRKPRREHKDMEDAAPGQQGRASHHADSSKKPKRSTTKKSSLRQHNTSRRKRVSLVIDGQTVLPADTVVEATPTSPSETSASNSTTSLDDMIDPRLIEHDAHTHAEHYEAVHHSLPRPMSNNYHSPTKPLIDTPSATAIHSPDLMSPTTTTPPLTYNAASRTFLDPSPIHQSSLPNPDPLSADDLSALLDEPAADAGFNTYVGGLHGSGVDDVDQAGSYGYPSSLGASYMESYMKGRPLKVRMETADKAGMSEKEKAQLLKKDEARGDKMEVDAERAKGADEEDNFMGEMDDF
jgi:hypothetical protein